MNLRLAALIFVVIALAVWLLAEPKASDRRVDLSSEQTETDENDTSDHAVMAGPTATRRDECAEPANITTAVDLESLFREETFNDERVRQALAILQSSDDLFDLTAAALLSGANNVSAQRRLEFVDRAMQVAPNDPVAHRLGYALCQKLDSCRETEISRRAAAWARADPDNAIAWAARTASELAEGNPAAEHSLRRASVSTRADSYFIELVARVEGALFGAGVSFPDSAAVAFGLAAALPTLELVNFCRETISAQRLMRDLCVDYYAVLASRGKNALHRSIGLSLQIELMANEANSDTIIADLQRTRALLRETLDPPKTLEGESREVWLMSSRQNFYDYVETFRSKNELAALTSVDAALAGKRAATTHNAKRRGCKERRIRQQADY